MRKIRVVLGAVVFLVACSGAHEIYDTRSESVQLEGFLGKPESIDFSTVKKYLFDRNCVGCHGAGEDHRANGVVLETFESVVHGNGERIIVDPFNPEESPLYTVLVAMEGTERHMPPAESEHPNVLPEKIKLVYTWIKNGAREHIGEEVQPVPTLEEQLQPYFDHPENIDYPLVRKYVLARACMKCHSKDGDAADREAIANSANLTNYRSLFNIFTPTVVKGKPEESKVYESAAITKTMPATKDGYELLNDLRLKLLRLWILNCAIEDKGALGGEILKPDPSNPEKVRECPVGAPGV